jgi:hypothetical protein
MAAGNVKPASFSNSCAHAEEEQSNNERRKNTTPQCAARRYLLPSDDRVHKVVVALVLVLDEVVEDLQQQGHVHMVRLSRVQKARSSKHFEQVHELDRRHLADNTNRSRSTSNRSRHHVRAHLKQ